MNWPQPNREMEPSLLFVHVFALPGAFHHLDIIWCGATYKEDRKLGLAWVDANYLANRMPVGRLLAPRVCGSSSARR